MRPYRTELLPQSTVIGSMGVRIPPVVPKLGMRMNFIKWWWRKIDGETRVLILTLFPLLSFLTVMLMGLILIPLIGWTILNTVVPIYGYSALCYYIILAIVSLVRVVRKKHDQYHQEIIDKLKGE